MNHETKIIMKCYPHHWLYVAFCLVAVCGGYQSAQAASKVKLAFVTNNASDFWTIARAGCTKASQDLGNVSVEFKIPEDGTAATQTRILDDLLSKGIDGVAISPVDGA
jgi:ribose transport system substrate-binding protein